MTTDLFAQQCQLVFAGICHEIGCDLTDLADDTLTVVAGPVASRPGVVALVATTGVRSVAAVPAELAAWVRNHAPEGGHLRALQPFFLADLASEVRRHGLADHPRAHGTSLGFALSTRPGVPVVPPGYNCGLLDMERAAGLRAAGLFPNALGVPGHRLQDRPLKGATAITGPQGSIVAVAGWWDEGNGLREIGVDVTPEARGEGLASAAVIIATRQVIDAGETPFYSCGADNIRSQRTALACGYLPVGLMGMVVDEVARRAAR